MQKTGEAYTAARAHLLQKQQRPRPGNYAKLAGMSDETLKAKTGCTWERWVNTLDRVHAYRGTQERPRHRGAPIIGRRRVADPAAAP